MATETRRQRDSDEPIYTLLYYLNLNLNQTLTKLTQT